MSLFASLLPLGRSPASAALPSTARRAIATTSARSSHIGSLPILCPADVRVENESPRLAGAATTTATARVRVVGPKGRLFIDLMPFVTLVHSHAHSHPSQPTPAPTPLSNLGSTLVSPASLSVHVADPAVKHQRAVWGLTRSLIANAVVGVSTGYTLSLRLVGVGYRAAMDDGPGVAQRINLKLGYAHPVLIDLPPDVIAATPTTTTIVLSGIDKQRLGEVAARIRRWRKPEPYNGKGIFVGDEVVRRKEVKSK